MDLKHLTTKAAALAAVLIGLGSISAQAAEIRVLNWKDYGTDAKWAVAAFRRRPVTRLCMTISTPNRRC